jgi:hypothetical protein
VSKVLSKQEYRDFKGFKQAAQTSLLEGLSIAYLLFVA